MRIQTALEPVYYLIRSHTNKLRNRDKEPADEKIFEAFERLDSLQEKFLNR